MAPGLRAAYERVRALLDGASRDEVRARHEVGAIVLEVKCAPDRYGASGVEQLAGALRVHVRTLYRSAAVAECWSAADVDALSRQADARGRPLSWSHLVLLGSVADADLRAELLRQTLARALSVRALMELVVAKARPVDDTARELLERLVARIRRESRRVAEAQSAFLAGLEGAPGWDREAVAMVEEALAAQLERRAQGGGYIEQLRAELVRMGSTTGGARLLAGVVEPGRVRLVAGPENPERDHGLAIDVEPVADDDVQGVTWCDSEQGV
jgi:ribosomal protein L17